MCRRRCRRSRCRIRSGSRSSACSTIGRTSCPVALAEGSWRDRVPSVTQECQRFTDVRTAQPLPSSTIGNTDGLRRRAHRPSLFAHSLDQQGSTQRTSSRILVHVHSGPSCQPVRLKSFQIDESRPDGQLASRNNVLASHLTRRGLRPAALVGYLAGASSGPKPLSFER